MKMIKTFKDLGRGDAGIAGGKGASLGEMTNAGIPVPDGFVVLSDAFEYFIRETDTISEIEATLKKVNHKEMESVERASETIRDIIENATMPKNLEREILDAYKTLDAEWVAVRSSATAEDGAEHAWAGQLDSFLNTSKKDLVKNVQRCFSSLFTPRAIFYRFEKGLGNSHISVAVVIQKMVQSEKSGIAFSVHPVTEDHNQMIVEASWGLGEAIVSGQVTPDSYVVTKQPKEILDTGIVEKTRGLFKSKDGSNEWEEIEDKKANEQCLSGKEILELSELIIKIENHYGFPCDIEWAYEKKKFYIVQSRPITTLQTSSNNLVPKELQIDYMKMGRWTMPPLDVETWHTEHTSKYFNDYFGITREALAVNIIGDETYNRMFIPKRFVEKLNKQIELWRKEGIKVFEKKLLQFYKDKRKIKKEVPKIKTKDYSKITNKRLIELYIKNRQWVHKIVAFDQLGWIADIEQSKILHETMSKIGLKKGAEEYNRVLFALIKPREISTTLEEKRAVIESVIKIKQKKTTLAQESKKLAKEFGWMPVLAFGTPWDGTWYKKEIAEVSKKPIEDLKREFLLLKKYTSVRDADINDVVKKYKIKKKELQIFVDYGLMLDTRNEAEYMNSLCGFYVLDMYKEISKRLKVSVDELRLMFEHEVISMLQGVLDPVEAISRKKGNCCVANIENIGRIELVAESAVALDQYAENHSTVDGEDDVEIGRGVSASNGKAEGIARIISSPEESHRVKDGEILFTFSTTVDYLPAMKRAAAIVTEVGGLTCHAAVVSREFGIPCVVSLKNAMTNFKDGDMVEVNADRGTVMIINNKGGGSIQAKNQIEKYHFHWKCSDTPFCVTEGAWTMSEGYGTFEYVILQEADLVTAYCTSKGVADQYAYGLLHLFNQSISLLKRLGSVYFIMEQMVLEPLANKVEEIAEGYNLTQDVLLHDDQFLNKLLEEEKMLVSNLKYLGHWKFVLHEHVEPVLRNILHLIDYITDSTGIPREHIMMLSHSEIIHFLNTGKVNGEELAMKTKGGVFVVKDGKTKFITGNDYMQIKKEAESTFSQDITGIVAYRGKVSGVVTLHLGWINTTDVPKGNILVAGMTNPQMVPYIKHAAAIITDEGGLTCHAAIIAREMKIPCIVGTKVATRVLKDGDMVEVDAEKGVVRILKRA